VAKKICKQLISRGKVALVFRGNQMNITPLGWVKLKRGILTSVDRGVEA
jgi:hypothetical protein